MMVALMDRGYGERTHVDLAVVADPFEQLFRAEYPIVVAIAAQVLADRCEAEDVAQEVFVSFRRSHPPTAPYAAAWLRAAAAHTALNVVRGQKRRARRETADASAQERLTGGVDRTSDPQRALDTAEQRREVRAALARLPERSATLLVLRYSGLSYAEVAVTLHVGMGQVGTLLRRAEAALRKEMGHDYR